MLHPGPLSSVWLIPRRDPPEHSAGESGKRKDKMDPVGQRVPWFPTPVKIRLLTQNPCEPGDLLFRPSHSGPEGGSGRVE